MNKTILMAACALALATSVRAETERVSMDQPAQVDGMIKARGVDDMSWERSEQYRRIYDWRRHTERPLPAERTKLKYGWDLNGLHCSRTDDLRSRRRGFVYFCWLDTRAPGDRQLFHAMPTDRYYRVTDRTMRKEFSRLTCDKTTVFDYDRPPHDRYSCHVRH